MGDPDQSNQEECAWPQIPIISVIGIPIVTPRGPFCLHEASHKIRNIVPCKNYYYCCACAARGQVIALGLDYMSANKISEVHFNTGRLLFEFNGLQYRWVS